MANHGEHPVDLTTMETTRGMSRLAEEVIQKLHAQAAQNMHDVTR